MAKKDSVKWGIQTQLGFSYFQQKCFTAISSPGVFGTLRADNLRTWRWEEPLAPTIVPTQCQSQGEPRREGWVAGWQGGFGTGAFGWCQGSEMSCACSAPVSDGVGPSWGSETLEVEGSI